MLVNGYAGLYNRWEENGVGRMERTLLNGVFWSCAEEGGYPGRQYSNKGLEQKNRAKVLVPVGAAEKEYVSPRVWQSLSDEEKKTAFTFQVGDILVFDEDTRTGEGSTPQQLLSSRPDAVCLDRVHPVMGPQGLSHWELEGV